MPIRTLIVDDVQTSSLVLKVLYELQPDVEVVGIVESKQEAIEFIETNQIDLASVDISLPDGDGFEVCAEIRKRFPKAFLVVCTIDENAENQVLATQHGVNYFAGKPLSTAQTDAIMQAYKERKAILDKQFSSSTQDDREWLWMQKKVPQ